MPDAGRAPHPNPVTRALDAPILEQDVRDAGGKSYEANYFRGALYLRRDLCQLLAGYRITTALGALSWVKAFPGEVAGALGWNEHQVTAANDELRDVMVAQGPEVEVALVKLEQAPRFGFGTDD